MLTAFRLSRLLLPTLLALLLIAGPAQAQPPADRGWDEAPSQQDVPSTGDTDADAAADLAILDPDSATEDDEAGVDPEPVLPAVHESIVKGRVARMRTDGKAAVPRGAPKQVRNLIRAANQIVGKPYKWGGGHASLVDRGYDCSGAVSYALIKIGLLNAPLVSGSLARAYAGGAGRYVAVYANKGHVYMEIAGLRLDTSSVGDPAGRQGVRWRPLIGKRAGFSTRHPLGL